MTKEEIVALLRDFIAIPSISTQAAHSHDMGKAVNFLSDQLKKIGFTIDIQRKTDAHPLLIASYQVGPEAKTIGIYGHYDVQPPEPLADWQSPPFELALTKGSYVARGVADDKGHIVQNIAAVASLISEKKLTKNIVFILEGEEEVGSANFEAYIASLIDVLARCDAFYITDVGMHAKNFPQIFYALRGLVYFELEITTGTKDLHSGVYGNRVHNATQVAMYLLTSMKDVNTGKVLVDGFYNDVRALPDKERVLLEKVRRSDEEEKTESGAFTMLSLDDANPALSSKVFPSLDVNGAISGFTEPGQKTVIPHQATVKFSTRLVENQNPAEITRLIRRHIEKYLPTGVQYSLKVLSSDHPFYTELQNEYVTKTTAVLEKTFGHKVVFNRSGGSIPAAEIFQRLFAKPVILTGFTLPNDNIHAPNENFDEDMFWKGIEALKKIYA